MVLGVSLHRSLGESQSQDRQEAECVSQPLWTLGYMVVRASLDIRLCGS